MCGVRGLLLFELDLERTISSSDSGQGSGGKGGLDKLPSMSASDEGGMMDRDIDGFRFLVFEDGVLWRSRSASSGVRTTMAPEPRTPGFGWANESMPRTYLGSEMRTGLAGAYEVGGDADPDAALSLSFVLRDSQCIVVDSEGRFAPGEAGRLGEEGGETVAWEDLSM